MRDDGLRSACFAELSRLTSRFGAAVPYAGGLSVGFPGIKIETPERRAWRPDPERLEMRLARFLTAA